MSTEGATPNQPQLELPYSKPHAILVLGGLAAAAIWTLYIAVFGLVTANIVLLIAGGATILLVAPVCASHILEPLHAIRTNSPVVTLNVYGITDTRKSGRFLAWEDVSRITLGNTQKTRSYLIVDLRNTAKTQTEGWGALRLFLRRAISMGERHVNLRPLKCNPPEVLAVAKQLHQNALRKKCGHRNGQSGTA